MAIIILNEYNSRPQKKLHQFTEKEIHLVKLGKNPDKFHEKILDSLCKKQ